MGLDIYFYLRKKKIVDTSKLCKKFKRIYNLLDEYEVNWENPDLDIEEIGYFRKFYNILDIANYTSENYAQLVKLSDQVLDDFEDLIEKFKEYRSYVRNKLGEKDEEVDLYDRYRDKESELFNISEDLLDEFLDKSRELGLINLCRLSDDFDFDVALSKLSEVNVINQLSGVTRWRYETPPEGYEYELYISADW